MVSHGARTMEITMSSTDASTVTSTETPEPRTIDKALEVVQLPGPGHGSSETLLREPRMAVRHRSSSRCRPGRAVHPAALSLRDSVRPRPHHRRAAQGMFLVVSDIDAAQDDLVRRAWHCCGSGPPRSVESCSQAPVVRQQTPLEAPHYSWERRRSRRVAGVLRPPRRALDPPTDHEPDRVDFVQGRLQTGIRCARSTWAVRCQR